MNKREREQKQRNPKNMGSLKFEKKGEYPKKIGGRPSTTNQKRSKKKRPDLNDVGKIEGGKGEVQERRKGR